MLSHTHTHTHTRILILWCIKIIFIIFINLHLKFISYTHWKLLLHSQWSEKDKQRQIYNNKVSFYSAYIYIYIYITSVLVTSDIDIHRERLWLKSLLRGRKQYVILRNFFPPLIFLVFRVCFHTYFTIYPLSQPDHVFQNCFPPLPELRHTTSLLNNWAFCHTCLTSLAFKKVQHPMLEDDYILCALEC